MKATIKNDLFQLILTVKENPESLNLIKNMIDEDPRLVTIQDINGYTALMIACLNTRDLSSIGTVQLLIDSGSNLEMVDGLGHSALMYASTHSNNTSTIETVKLLIDSGANVNNYIVYGCSCESALMHASMNTNNTNNTSNIETVKLLIDSGADVNAESLHGWSAVLYAICNSVTTSNVETVKLLIDRGATIDSAKYLFALSHVPKESSTFDAIETLIAEAKDNN